MQFRARLRAADWSFWVPFAATVVALVFVVMSLVDPQWIESLFGESPDGGSGEAEWGIAVCDLPGDSGERAYARIDDPVLMAEAEATELVGASVDLVAGDGNVNRLKR